MKSPLSTLVWLLVCLTLVGALGGFVGGVDPCGDDGCSPTCGDCLACGQVARVQAPQVVIPVLVAPAGPIERDGIPPIPPPRTIDHVPLPRA